MLTRPLSREISTTGITPFDYEIPKVYFHCTIQRSVPVIADGIKVLLYYPSAFVSKESNGCLYSGND